MIDIQTFLENYRMYEKNEKNYNYSKPTPPFAKNAFMNKTKKQIEKSCELEIYLKKVIQK